MFVDNGIVVLENVFRRHQLGEEPFRAAARGKAEVWGAVVASTLANLAVFLPVLFVKEEAGQLFRDIALAIRAALGLSLLVSVAMWSPRRRRGCFAAAARDPSPFRFRRPRRGEGPPGWLRWIGSQRIQMSLATAIAFTGFTPALAGLWPSARDAVRLQARPFGLQDVRLLDGPFRDAMERTRRYLHELNEDRLLYRFRETAGLPAPGEPLGGWERTNVRSRAVGHYLSACAMMVAATGDEGLHAKAGRLGEGRGAGSRGSGPERALGASAALGGNCEDFTRQWVPPLP